MTSSQNEGNPTDPLKKISEVKCCTQSILLGENRTKIRLCDRKCSFHVFWIRNQGDKLYISSESLPYTYRESNSRWSLNVAVDVKFILSRNEARVTSRSRKTLRRREKNVQHSKNPLSLVFFQLYPLWSTARMPPFFSVSFLSHYNVVRVCMYHFSYADNKIN